MNAKQIKKMATYANRNNSYQLPPKVERLENMGVSSDGINNTMEIIQESDDHIYANINYYNSTLTDIPASLSITRTQPIIKNPNLYNIAVVRMGVPSSGIPLFIFLPNTYIVTLSYLGVDYQEVVTHTSTDFRNSNSIYNINSFLTDINNAFASVFGALPGAPVASQPFMLWNPATELFQLIYTPDYITAGVQIWMNQELYLKFNGFYIFFAGYNTPGNKDIQFILSDLKNNTVVLGEVTYLFSTQDGPDPSAITDFQTIILTTNGMGVVSESVQNVGSPMIGFNETANISNILTDFEPPIEFISTASILRLQYQPSLYRLVPLINSSPLYTIDIQISWKAKNGSINQIVIPPGENFNLKLLFLKKGLQS
jgi:hypothetical protein